MTGLKNFIGTERFAIKRRLGAGSFGVVYEAFDQETNSTVALKVLHQALFQESGEALYRFKREFRALADVTHPNLISLYELISDGEQWFFTMELVRGINFLDYVYDQETIENNKFSSSYGSRPSSSFDGPTVEISMSDMKSSSTEKLDSLPKSLSNNNISNPTEVTPQTLNLKRLRIALRQLAEGVYTLHKAGKLHRDIKPSNVLVTAQGRVVILDFGLVTELHTDPNIHASFGFLGTPTHMSPEQSACMPVSEASDWYSVGVILYQALTGKLPFVGKMEQIISQRLEFEPPTPSSLLANIPFDLDELCVSLLRREPENRPNGKEVINRLRGVTSELPASSLALALSSSQAPSSTSTLVGREEQLAALQSAFNLTQKGQAVLVYLHGSSGMGKSALVREFLSQLQNTDSVILAGRCYEQEAVPYKAVDNLIDTLSQYLKNLPLLESEILMPRDILVLSRLFPVLSQVHSVSSARRKPQEIDDSQELRRRAFTALRELLGRLADRKPLVLFIDDLHWGDLDSVSLLQEIFHPPDPPPLMLIVTYRTEEIESSPVVKEILKLRSNNSAFITEEISLPELSIIESEKLALTMLENRYQPNKADLKFIAQEASGSPFFLSELIKYFQSTNYDIKRFSSSQNPLLENEFDLSSEDLPVTKLMSLDEMLRIRIAQLPEYVRTLLEIIAVAGRPISWAIAKKVACLETDEKIILTILRTQHLIRVRETSDQEKVETYHDRIRENIVTYLPIEKLKHYHLSLGEVLENEKETDPETLASHFFNAHQFKKAAEYTTIAADKAYQLLAFDQAARLYQLVIGLEPEQSSNKALWQHLADSLANSGRSAEAAKAYLTAAQLETNEANFIQLQRMAAEKYLISGHMDEGLEVLRTFLNRVGLTLPASPKRALLSFLYKRAQIWWRGLKFQERDENTIPKEELMRIDTCWAGSIGLGIVDTTLGADFQARHLLLALNAGEPYRIVRALAMEAGYSATGGSPNRAQAEEYVQAALELSAKLNQPHAIGLTKVMAGQIGRAHV